MNFTTIVAIVGALGDAIGTVPIVLGWMKGKHAGQSEVEATKSLSSVASEVSYSATVLHLDGTPDSSVTFDADNGTMRLFLGNALLILAVFDQDAELSKARSYFMGNMHRADWGLAHLFEETLGKVVPISVTDMGTAQTTHAHRPISQRSSEISTKWHRLLLTHLPPAERQFSEGFLEDGIQHLTSAGEPVPPFILKETRDTTLWILKLRLSKFVRSRRRQVS